MERWIWGGGRLQRVLAYGIPFGLAMGLYSLGDDGPVLAAVVGGVLAGGMFGVGMTYVVERKWARLNALDPADRLTVLRAVRYGERVVDPRLTPAVTEQVVAMRGAAKTVTRDRWFVAIATVVAVVAGIVMARDGWDWADIVPWAIAALGVVGSIVGPRRLATRLAKAEETAA